MKHDPLGLSDIFSDILSDMEFVQQIFWKVPCAWELIAHVVLHLNDSALKCPPICGFVRDFILQPCAQIFTRFNL